MPAEIFAVAGARISIGGAMAPEIDDLDATDFAGETWTEIDGWATMGTVGDSATQITQTLINRGRTMKAKGTRDAGTMENTFAILPADPGQIALKAAEKTRNNYAFRVVFDDPATGGGTGTTLYFVALVMSAQEAGGEANTARILNATLDVNSNIVNVAAT